ncbi:MAG: acetyl esterase, partial [Flavobacteriales bacterium]
MTPILQWCLSFPEWVLRPFAGRSEVIDGQVLDVDAQLVLRVMRRMPSVGADGALPVAEARQAFRRVPKYVRRAWRRPTEDVVIPLAGRDLPARIYRAESAEGEQAPVLLWFHGGGWVIGDLETAEVVCHQLSTFGGFDVVSVDYRLAPEHPYPAAADDAIESADWIAEHGHQWGLRSGSVSVSGDSAGGNLAAVASLYSDHVCAQLDVYGGVDLSHGKASKTLFADGYLLTARGVDWFGAQYWPDPTRKAEPKASPLLADDLSSMPPA